MNIHSELAAGDIQWGDVAAWAEAIGTTGTLITGMFILLRDRMNLYRALINGKIVKLFPFRARNDT